MKRSKLHISLYYIIGLVLALTFTGCETGRAACEGKIVVENTIPDTTLYLGGEPFRRDLLANPPVFIHTADQQLIFNASTFSSSVAAGIQKNPNTGNISILHVEAVSAGNGTVTVTAMDACPEYEVNTSFNVTVLDTSN